MRSSVKLVKPPRVFHLGLTTKGDRYHHRPSPSGYTSGDYSIRGHNRVDLLDCAAVHPGSKGIQFRSTTGSCTGVEDENREFAIIARDVLFAADSQPRLLL